MFNHVTIEVGNYTGTGQSGESYPNSLSFDKEPVFVAVLFNSKGQYYPNPGPNDTWIWIISPIDLTTSYQDRKGFGNRYTSYLDNPKGKKSSDGRTMYWYANNSASDQFNESGIAYYWIAVFEA